MQIVRRSWMTTQRRLVLGAVTLGVITAAVPGSQKSHAQQRTRLNTAIEALENGRPAVAGQEWRFIDMEHAPFSSMRLESILAEMDTARDASGRLTPAPLVRIPQEGDEDFKWAVKQVLDLGVFGVVLPHVDTKEEAVRLVQTMRYPPARDSAYREPRGVRGWGPGRAVRLWNVADTLEYHRRADVWPLNPEGELFAVAMIESAEAVRNIVEILEAPVSAIMVVPGDLSIDLGLGPRGVENFPEVEAAYEAVLTACQSQQVVICGCADSSNRTQRRLDEGWRFILPLS